MLGVSGAPFMHYRADLSRACKVCTVVVEPTGRSAADPAVRPTLALCLQADSYGTK